MPGRAGIVGAVQVELTLNCSTQSNKTVQADLAYETTKSVLRRNNNYQRVKNGLIQRLFNLWQVWQTLIEPTRMLLGARLNKGHVQKVLGVVSKGIYQQKEWQKECISAMFQKPNGNVKSCNLIFARVKNPD